MLPAKEGDEEEQKLLVSGTPKAVEYLGGEVLPWSCQVVWFLFLHLVLMVQKSDEKTTSDGGAKNLVNSGINY